MTQEMKYGILMVNLFLEQINKQRAIDVYIDGACLGNPGPGGWGVFGIQDPYNFSMSGRSEGTTTNNKMEMLAAVKALEVLPEDLTVFLHTDSQYLKNGITVWIKTWKENGWRTKDKKPVKNQALWQSLDFLCFKKKPNWKWVKGHSGVYGNERADALAKNAIK
jgi:ribonuclease HI